MTPTDITAALSHTAYYSDDFVTIIHGDCREILPTLPDASVDLIFTDPPYGLNFNSGGDLAHRRECAFGKAKEAAAEHPISNDGEEAYGLFESMLGQSSRLLKRPGCCCCCCGGGGPLPLFAHWSLLMDKYLDFKQAVVWDKGGLGMGIHYRRNYEFVLVAKQPGRCTWNGGNSTPNVFRLNKIIPQAHQHPTEKPVGLARHFIQLHSNPGELVLDPFMGSGSTLRAAKDLHRKAIGIEVEERYCEMAAERMAQEVLPI